MRKLAWSTLVLPLLALPFLALPFGVTAQSLMSATYITAEQVQAVNALPGVDRQIISRDIGKLNLAVGVIHRGATGGAGRSGGGGGAALPPAPICGVSDGSTSGTRGSKHYYQTETYVIISGGGTLVTGGDIMNGRESDPGGRGATILNGLSCGGTIVGDFQSRDVKVGDLVIIPAGVPHGWSNVPDHVDYLSVRPDPDRVLDDYVNPAIELP